MPGCLVISVVMFGSLEERLCQRTFFAFVSVESKRLCRYLTFQALRQREEQRVHFFAHLHVQAAFFARRHVHDHFSTRDKADPASLVATHSPAI